MNRDEVAGLTGPTGYFEDFTVGQRIRHARGTTIGEVENAMISKQVMNTAQAHWNEHYLTGGPLGAGRVVFGLVTASVVFGLASQDTAEQALAEVGCTGLRFRAPVHHGDTLYAFTEVEATEAAPDRDDAGLVTFRHWGVSHDDRLVFEGVRTVLLKRRSHWRSTPDGVA
jgi:itaconyl-CoA hydratase